MKLLSSENLIVLYCMIASFIINILPLIFQAYILEIPLLCTFDTESNIIPKVALNLYYCIVNFNIINWKIDLLSIFLIMNLWRSLNKIKKNYNFEQEIKFTIFNYIANLILNVLCLFIIP